MKKLFIGCGIIVLLIVGALGYLTYQVYPAVKDWQTQWAAAFERLAALEHEHAFDAQAQTGLPLDSQRFAASLELRADLADDLTGVGEQLDELSAAGPDGDRRGFIDAFKQMFRTAAPLLATFATRLESRQMAWPEFAWHTRLLWACLIRVDAGVGPPELEPLRGTFGRLNEAYEAARKRAGRDFPPLTEIIGTFPTPLLNEASALLVRDLDRVQRGLRFFGMDPQYMQPVSRMEDLQSLQLAPEDFAQHMDRRARHTDEMQGGHGDDDGNGGGYGASEGAGDGTGHHDGAGKSDAGQPAPAPGATEPAGAPVPLGKEPGASPAPAKPPKQDAPAEPDKPGGK